MNNFIKIVPDENYFSFLFKFIRKLKLMCFSSYDKKGYLMANFISSLTSDPRRRYRSRAKALGRYRRLGSDMIWGLIWNLPWDNL